jgi:hypothetical protein
VEVGVAVEAVAMAGGEAAAVDQEVEAGGGLGEEGDLVEELWVVTATGAEAQEVAAAPGMEGPDPGMEATMEAAGRMGVEGIAREGGRTMMTGMSTETESGRPSRTARTQGVWTMSTVAGTSAVTSNM